MEQLLNDFSPGLFIMQSVLMLAVIFLMVKFAWKPIISALDEREEGIKNALEAAEKAKQEMESISSSNEKLFNQAREDRDAMLKEAREMKAKMIAEAEANAEAEAAKIIASAKEAIEVEKKEALAEIKAEVAQLSISVAEKLLKEELSDAKKDASFVNGLLGEVNLK
ncbi:MAG: F0F1 ATP synthase subunit B [Flavobacteriaceae bacterium]|jgi:F-type H+-transporting ATPase subunit b|nr:F0F1 ATP synthase subunit B [Flavobacteriaceae bacterium]